jgi:hypothetical protein
VQSLVPKHKTLVSHYQCNKIIKLSNVSMKQLHFAVIYSVSVLPNVVYHKPLLILKNTSVISYPHRITAKHSSNAGYRLSIAMSPAG